MLLVRLRQYISDTIHKFMSMPKFIWLYVIVLLTIAFEKKLKLGMESGFEDAN